MPDRLTPDEQRRDCLAQWDGAAGGWAKAQAWMRALTAGVSHWLVDALELQPGQRVLELAAGAGETGFLAAELIAPGGTLICSDQSQAMIDVARDRAAELGLQNVEFRLINAESIDLPVASVDAVICRWGYMLMVDPQAALSETRRVLGTGGRVAMACWAELAANPWFALPREVLVAHGLLDPPDPGAPGPFALSDPDHLRELLEQAGFTEIEIDAIDLDFDAGNFEAWWEMQIDISPWGATVRAAGSELRAELAAEVAERLSSEVTGRTLVAVASA